MTWQGLRRLTSQLQSRAYLLGVQSTTSNLLCLAELSTQDRKCISQKRERTFTRKFRETSTGEEPMAEVLQTPMSCQLSETKHLDLDPERIGNEFLKQCCIE